MATCKIMRRNFAMKIGSSKEVYSGKDIKSMFARKSNEMFSQSLTNNSTQKKEDRKYWNDFKQSKMAFQREENIGPLRAMCSTLYTAKPSIMQVASGGIISTGSLTSTINRAYGQCKEGSPDKESLRHKSPYRRPATDLSDNRNLLKTSHKVKILNRGFGSSASSSCSSIFKRQDEKRRVSSIKKTVQNGYFDREYNTQLRKDAGGNMSSSKYLVSLRNQNMSSSIGSASQAAKVSSRIQQELMPIDKTIRERISLKNTNAAKAQKHEPKNIDPLCGWNHPPSPDIFSNRFMERLAEKRTVSNLAQEKAQEGWMRTPNRKSKLEMQCRPMQEPPCQSATSAAAAAVAAAATRAAASPQTKRLPVPQNIAPMMVCDSGVSSESVSHQMAHLTARHIANVDQQPKRRFSLRRPPTTTLTEITPPAPGPAAESLIQQHKGSNSVSQRTTSSIPYTYNESRYSRLNNRPY